MKNEMPRILKSLAWIDHEINFVRDKSDRFVLLSAYQTSRMSPDPSTKNGAILVRDNGCLATFGVNKFPMNVEETEERLADREFKYKTIVHAEASAIINAARVGIPTHGCTLYCPFYSCCDCAKTIIEAGIKRVVGHAQLMAIASTHVSWIDSIVHGWNMMEEAGVKCDLFYGKLDIKTRFNHEDVSV